MTQPEDFDVDRNGQDPDAAGSGPVDQWDGRDEPGRDRPRTAAGDGDATDKVATAMMAALIALAVIASVVMLFTDSTGWMKIAVLAGLWAAVIGALLVTRYRRQLASERERIADLEVMHSLELDRELSTHREQELILEQNYLDSLDAKSDDTISQLRAEITALREHLAELLGADLDEERIALRARAERLRELDAPPSSSPLKDPESHQRPKPRATAHRAEATANGSVGTHTNHGPHGPTVQGVPEEWDENEAFEPHDDVDHEPVDVPVVDNGTDSDAESSEQTGVPGHAYGGGFNTGSFKAVPWESDPEPATSAPEPDATESRPTAVLPRIAADEQAAHTADFPAVDESDAPAETAPTVREGFPDTDADADDADADSAADADAVDADTADDAGRRSRHGRRRAEDHEGGLTVAELLAQMRARKDSGE